MATETPATPGAPSAALPDFLRAAKPNPITNRAPWYKNTAPTYAGIFLWFIFWYLAAYNGMQEGGLVVALVGILIAALICHFLFYLVPGLLGVKTGLPLYIVGTSTFGTVGGLLIPGFLMGVLQFGWLGVNTYGSSLFLAQAINPALTDKSVLFYAICVVWAVAAAFVGLKGIQYVAKVATFLPLIPLAVLILGLANFAPSAGEFKPTAEHTDSGQAWLSISMMVTYIVGFFATAGAAGVDFGMNNRDRRDVQLGGLVGIVLAILFTAGASCVIVAGARVDGILLGTGQEGYDATNAFQPPIVSEWVMRFIKFGLPIASFPGACFSSFIAANSFKTVMPRVNSFLSVGVGTLVSILLAVTAFAAKLAVVFGLIGASFGPICGAMLVDYILAGRKWAGPRAGFNPAGWVAWLLGFIVGILPNELVKDRLAPYLSETAASYIANMPAPPVTAFVVGAVVYLLLSIIGLQSRVIPYAPAAEQQAA